ncbi:Ankyrin-2, partial [Cichlidogyrus casuarinus]
MSEDLEEISLEDAKLLSTTKRRRFSRSRHEKSSSSSGFGNSIGSFANLATQLVRAPTNQEATEELIEEYSTDNMIQLARQGNWTKIERVLKRFKNNSIQRIASAGKKRRKKTDLKVRVPQIKCKKTEETLLMLACKDCATAVIEILVELHAGINDRSRNGASALHYAAMYAREDSVKFLLTSGANANLIGFDERDLPLHSSCRRTLHAHAIVEVLCRAYPEGRLVENAKGFLPIHLAAQNRNNLAIIVLLSSCPESQLSAYLHLSNGDSTLHITARQKDASTMKTVLEKKADPNALNNDQETALHICARLGFLCGVKLLQAFNADAGLKDLEERTALHFAASEGHTEIVEYIIEKFPSCDILARDRQGNSLIHVAASRGHQETALTLLKKGVPLHTPNMFGGSLGALEGGCTMEVFGEAQVRVFGVDRPSLRPGGPAKYGSVCLHAACEMGHVQMVRTLLARKANVNARNKAGFTPLHVAVERIRPAVVELLLGNKAQVNTRTSKDGRSALHIAACIGRGERSAEMLIKSGADVNQRMQNGETALHLASRVANLRMVETLLREDADIQLVCEGGNNALHIAVRYCNHSIVQLLINYAKNHLNESELLVFINQKNKEGETALHFAAELTHNLAHCPFEDTDMIKTLLKLGADINTQTLI